MEHGIGEYDFVYCGLQTWERREPRVVCISLLSAGRHAAPLREEGLACLSGEDRFFDAMEKHLQDEHIVLFHNLREYF